MFTWIIENIATIFICLFLALLVAAIIAKLVKDRKKGTSSCGCNCSGCLMGDSCHKHEKKIFHR